MLLTLVFFLFVNVWILLFIVSKKPLSWKTSILTNYRLSFFQKPTVGTAISSHANILLINIYYFLSVFSYLTFPSVLNCFCIITNRLLWRFVFLVVFYLNGIITLIKSNQINFLGKTVRYKWGTFISYGFS